jgi:hypothetical protein
MTLAAMVREREPWLDAMLAARAQTLDDLAVCELATVAALVCDGPTDAMVDGLADSALDAGFAIASTSLLEHGTNDLDDVTRALAASLRTPVGARGRRHGLAAALDAFAGAHGKRAEERFVERAEAEGLDGELHHLTRDYLASAAGRPSPRRLNAWLAGRQVSPSADELALRPLSARTAKRALAQLTRLVRVLGARGTRIVLVDADALVSLSPGRRDLAYGVLRELCDNGDGWRGMVATEILLVGSSALERRAHALHEHAALASRVLPPAGQEGPASPFPHQSWVRVPAPVEEPARLRSRPVDERRSRSLRALVRAAQGLPPIEAAPELTVGMQEVDARIEQLFAHAESGSMFAVLSGAYGAGKTHHVLFLEARALAAKRPVFRLAVERLDEDLGNPQRHLRRLLDGAILPGRRRTGPLERLDAWLASERGRRRLGAALRAAVAGGGESARAAERALAGSTDGELDAATVLETLGGIDLVDKPSSRSYRKDAYARLHLWLELLAALEGCEGPVIILDEAENLYRPGVSRAERRTALRTLGFYCGGALERACVVLAVTPESLERLREEAGELLDEIEEQATLLPVEDVALLRRRLLRARPIQVTRLARADLVELAKRGARVVQEVRGVRADASAAARLAERAAASAATPREAIRRAVLAAEAAAWSAAAGS